MPKPFSQDLRNRVMMLVERGEMSRRAATRRHEISESVAIKWLERVERDGSRRSARRVRPEKPSGRVGKPRLARPLPPGLSRGFLGGTSRWTISGDLEP